ncbi:MAG: hypothetical protein ABLT11_01385 [Candidatus Acidiferrum sp.]
MNSTRATGLLAAAIFLTVYPASRGNSAASAAAPAVALAAEPPQTLAGPAEIYPDATMTPGDTNPDITQENIGENICKKGWSTSSVRPPTSVTNKIKKDTMAAYGFTGLKTNYELDHLISLQNGGCPKCVTNLWPEAYGDVAHPMNQKTRSHFNKTHPDSTLIFPGALQKDLVENHIHDEICRDIPHARFSLKAKFPPTVRITLKRGQEILTTDWYACYLNMMDGNKPCL